jgi:hypothetical protein
MFRITAIFAASIIAFASFTSGVDAKGPSVRKSVKAAKSYVGGTKENSVTLTDKDSSGGIFGNTTPLQGNGVKSLLPGGGGILPGKPGPAGGIARPKPTIANRAATANILNNVLPQAISAGTQIINRIKERDGTLDEGDRSILQNRGRRARGPVFDPISPGQNFTRRSYGTAESEPTSLLDGNNSPEIEQFADDNANQTNVPTEAPQLPADTGSVQPLSANSAPDPAGDDPGSLTDLLARDDARMFQRYLQTHARNTKKYNSARTDFWNDPVWDKNPTTSFRERMNKFMLIKEQYYIDQIAELRDLEESVQYADFAKQRIANLYDEFKSEKVRFNEYMQMFDETSRYTKK